MLALLCEFDFEDLICAGFYPTLIASLQALSEQLVIASRHLGLSIRFTG